jgi:uncharacterized damage-inducible protein DinB
MAMNQALIPEFDHEMANTRKAIERVPDAKWDWKPHAKSGTVGWYVNHLVLFPGWLAHMFTCESLDVAPGGKQIEQPKANNTKEALAIFDKGVADARATLAKATDEQLMQTWTLLANGQTFFSMPRVAAYRGMIMNHMIHHRGQLTVYFRLNDIAVPGLYGPSGDEVAAQAAGK